MLSGSQATSVGGAHLTFTSNKSICCVCWYVQGLVMETTPAINVVKENGFVMLALLSHTATGLYYITCLGDQMSSEPSKHLIIDSSVAVVCKSFSRAFAKHNIEEGFNVKGSYPLSRYVFDEDEFCSSFLLTCCNEVA